MFAAHSCRLLARIQLLWLWLRKELPIETIYSKM